MGCLEIAPASPAKVWRFRYASWKGGDQVSKICSVVARDLEVTGGPLARDARPQECCRVRTEMYKVDDQGEEK